jgi:hypothetical protein
MSTATQRERSSKTTASPPPTLYFNRSLLPSQYSFFASIDRSGYPSIPTTVVKKKQPWKELLICSEQNVTADGKLMVACATARDFGAGGLGGY